jgi:diacylglycerol kinase (ATP)
MLGKEIQRLNKALGYSLAGLAAALRTQASFRSDMLAVLIGLPLAIWLGDNGVERALLAGSLLLLLVAEMINSAIEAVVDRIGPEHHPLSGQAKDMGSAAVFLVMVLIAVVWALVLLDRL